MKKGKRIPFFPFQNSLAEVSRNMINLILNKNKNKRGKNLPYKPAIVGDDILNKNSKKYTKNKNSKASKKGLIKRKTPDGAIPGTIKSVPKVFIIVLEEYVKDVNHLYTVKEVIDQLVDHHNSLIKNHGIKERTKLYNTMRLYIINSLEGNIPTNPSFMAVSERWKFPSKLSKMLDFFINVLQKRCDKSDRFIRSVFYLNRLVTDYKEIDLSEITKEYTVPINFKLEFLSFLRDWKTKVEFERSPDLITEPTEKLMNNGPNGKPKWQTADVEAYALLNSELSTPFVQLCEMTGNQKLLSFMRRIAAKQTKALKKRIRYITSFGDKANRSRGVAISDYWTQILLRPLMLEIQEVIQEYFSDFTSITSHSSGFNKLKKFIRQGIKCYDISSWTDAFPASLQVIVLEELYSNELAHAWHGLVVDCDWDVRGSSVPVRYARGQGMGTSGSFDIATLTDLLVLEFIYLKYYNIKSRNHDNESELLFDKTGDDLWAWDLHDHIYNTYIQKLGIDINVNKTKSVTSTNLVGEYVSRNINYNKDVSRISANICRAVSKNILDIPELARHLEEREVNILPIKGILDLKPKINKDKVIRTFFLLTQFYPRKEGMKLLNKAIRKDFHDFVYVDPIISLLNKNSIKNLKYSFLLWSIENILPQIEERMKEIFSNTYKIQIIEGCECSLDLVEENERDNSFKYRSESDLEESLESVTSRKILFKCFTLINSLYTILNQNDDEDDSQDEIATVESSPTKSKIIPVILVTSSKSEEDKSIRLKQLSYIFDRLNAILQNLTFKELGIIDTTKKAHRPTTTKLYNYITRLHPITDLCELNIHKGDHNVWSLLYVNDEDKDSNVVKSYLSKSFTPSKSVSKLISNMYTEDLKSHKEIEESGPWN